MKSELEVRGMICLRQGTKYDDYERGFLTALKWVLGDLDVAGAS